MATYTYSSVDLRCRVHSSHYTQSSIDVEPSEVVVVKSGHSSHTLMDTRAAKYPIGQGVHSDDPPTAESKRTENNNSGYGDRQQKHC